MLIKPLILTLPILLEGCAGSFACKGLPQFPSCKSATEAYKATDRPLRKEQISDPQDSDLIVSASQGKDSPTVSSPVTDREGAKTLKIWFAPFEDEEGNLMSARYVIAEVEPKRWRLGGISQPVPKRLVPLQVASIAPAPQGVTPDQPRGPLFPMKGSTPRFQIEDVDYQEP
jgi:conjugal transfer pilus assembly protein TraV